MPFASLLFLAAASESLFPLVSSFSFLHVLPFFESFFLLHFSLSFFSNMAIICLLERYLDISEDFPALFLAVVSFLGITKISSICDEIVTVALPGVKLMEIADKCDFPLCTGVALWRSFEHSDYLTYYYNFE